MGHTIYLSALGEKYYAIEAVVAYFRCLVIFFVKANGYGNRSIQTAMLLADVCGSGKFEIESLGVQILLKEYSVN